MRICASLLSHCSMGIHVTWVKLTQNKSGNMTGTWPIKILYPLTNWDWFTTSHMTQPGQLESLGKSGKCRLGGRTTFSLA